jgi:Fe-S-cluster containining protein
MSADHDTVRYNPPGFVCTACGVCCESFTDDHGVVLFAADVERLAAHLGLVPEAFVARHCARTLEPAPGLSVHVLAHRGGACVFLDGDKRCAVHEAKPEQCRRGPFGFFWDGERKYPCMSEPGIHMAGWSTEAWDRTLVQIHAGRAAAGNPSPPHAR